MTGQDSRKALFNEAYEIITQDRLLAHKEERTVADRIAKLRRRLRYQFLPHYWGRPPRWRVYLRGLNHRRVLPNFACVGPIKAGTSDLANYLFEHPAILPPLTKEIPSFNSRDWRPHYPTEAELARVRRKQGAALTGFFYPWIHRLLLTDELSRVSPDARIILLLRDPVKRVYSHYKWELFLGGAWTRRSKYFQTYEAYVRTAIEVFPAMNMPAPCGQQPLSTGIYHPSVRQWVTRFGRDNVHIVIAEDFFRDPTATVAECFEFLGIEPLQLQYHEPVNANPIDAPAADEESVRHLSAFYRPYNEALYEWLGRDLGWT